MEAIGPTDERVRHADPVTIGGKQVRIVQVPSPVRAEAGKMVHQVALPHVLEKYYAQGWLAPKDPEQNRRRYLAGVMIRDAWEESGLSPMVVGGYEPSVDGYKDPDGRLVAAVDAGRRWRRLMSHAGPECFWTVYLACCVGESVGNGVTMARLRKGLARVADEEGV